MLADYLESAQTRRWFMRDRAIARSLSEAFQGIAIRAITAREVRGYITHRRSAGISDSSIKREIGLFHAAVNAWKIAHSAPDLPNPARSGLREPPGRVRWLTHEQADILLAVCKTRRCDHLRDFVALALNTGMRSGEMLELEWSRVDSDGPLSLPGLKAGVSRGKS